MMDHVVSEILDIDNMPRGGPDASWLDRRLRTDRLEYLDRDDVDDLKRRVIQALDRGERMLGQHALTRRVHQFARCLQPVGAADIGPVRRPADLH